jgi:hypothetical protein
MLLGGQQYQNEQPGAAVAAATWPHRLAVAVAVIAVATPPWYCCGANRTSISIKLTRSTPPQRCCRILMLLLRRWRRRYHHPTWPAPSPLRRGLRCRNAAAPTCRHHRRYRYRDDGLVLLSPQQHQHRT